MSRPPDHMCEVSEALSEVMGDIGVNKRIVMKRRRAYKLMENIWSIIVNKLGCSNFCLGSQSEGSTTLGLESDTDVLSTCNTDVIQSMSEMKPGVVNLLMIQNENISPGYCYVQYITPDLPGSVNDIDSPIMKHCDIDSEGRLLLRNTYIMKQFHTHYDNVQTELHGPAFSPIESQDAISGGDLVRSYYCESSPQVTSWLQKQRGCKWPTEDVLEECRKSGCFVVPVGSKVTYTPELEWRISTSLQERYLMFSVNITQLRCYTLMKMILKTYIEPRVEDVLSSYMCKNVLWYCIANSSQDWHTINLLSYLHLCLFVLKECVEQRNCPHFMIPENNLLAGRMTDTQRGKILDIMNSLMGNDAQFLYEIKLDGLGRRLKTKLNMISHGPYITPATRISQIFSSRLVFLTARTLDDYLRFILEKIKHDSMEKALPYLFTQLTNLERYRREDNLHTASKLLIPLVSSTLGSVLASRDIASHEAISDEAFKRLEAGKEYDALSGRLKLASVLYCTGDMERAEKELRISQEIYTPSLLDATCKRNDGSACECYAKAKIFCISEACDDYNEAAIKTHLPLTPLFLICEINCVPHELRYELQYSYTLDYESMLLDKHLWMKYIAVDSVSYLYFIQYKTYGHLQNRAEQQLALSKLARSINFEPFPRLSRTDKALNLLGQCYEQENRQTEAFQCYILSLKHRVRKNAARFLLCIQLSKLWKQEKTQ